MPTTKYTPKDIARFWSKVAVTDDKKECWNWKPYLIDGYGYIGVQGKMLRSNRTTWEITNGEIPDGLYVLHTCDNRACCNPNHLFLGTHLDNMKDRDAKGRGKMPGLKGEVAPGAKLTQAQVDEIRRRHAAGGISQQALADEYGVGNSQINRIIKRRDWK